MGSPSSSLCEAGPAAVVLPSAPQKLWSEHLGVVDFLSKPLEVKRFDKAINKILMLCNLPNVVAKPKENLFGIGYKGLDRGSNVLGHVNLFGAGTR